MPSLANEPTHLPANVWKICAVAMLGPFLAQLDSTVVNVSLATLALDLHSSLSTIQWVISGYLLTLALMLPLSGWLVHRIGARALYLWCFTSFTLSSALCGMAWSSNALIGFRVLQGISGGLLAPMAQMMIARAAGRHMTRVMGYATLPVLFAPILGPVLAGAILQHATWRWLFFINLPVGVLAVSLALLFLPKDRDELQSRPFDLPGFAMLSPGLVLFLYGSDHLSKPAGIACFVSALLLIAAFIRHALRKGPSALLDLRLFHGKIFKAAAITQFLHNGAVFAGQMLLPLYLIRASGQSPSATGLLLAPVGLGMLCVYPLAGTLTQRFGIRKVSVTGATIGLLSTAPLIYMALHGFNRIAFEAILFFRGMGLSAIGIPTISAAYSSVSKEKLPMATTTLNIVQRIGGPTFTTVTATFLGWQLMSTQTVVSVSHAFSASFALLCALQTSVIFSTMRLPLTIDKTQTNTEEKHSSLQVTSDELRME